MTGLVVLDLSRMLPGAVLDRLLLDLGARILKVESPAGGDPLRLAPAGFAAFLGGAESLALDLAQPPAAAAVRRLAARADVLVESFRPGTLARWGLDPAALQGENPRLVVCSLSSFGSEAPWRDDVGHDLNFAAASGLLSLLAGDAAPQVPGIQLVDVTAGILAGTSILAALLERERTGRGRRIEQPLALAPLPFLAWAWAEGGAAGGASARTILEGGAPAYRLYACAGGERVALGAVEPKLWLAFLEVVGLQELAETGLDVGEAGRRAGERVAARLTMRPRAEWLALARERGIPLTPLNDVAEAMAAPFYVARGGANAAWLGAAEARPPGRAPALGEHTAAVLGEAGLPSEQIAAARGE